MFQLDVPSKSVLFIFSKQAAGRIDIGPAVVGKLFDKRALRTKPERIICARMAPSR